MNLAEMSDEELMEIAGQTAPASTPTAGVAEMDEAELMAIAGIKDTPKTEMAQQMEQEKSGKKAALAAAKAIEDPAERDQAIRDAMRLGTMTSGEASEEEAQANEFVAANQAPIQLKSGEIKSGFSVEEASMEPTLLVLDLVTAGLQSRGVKTAAGMYDAITEGFTKRGEYALVVNSAVKKYAKRKGVSDSKLAEILNGVPEDKQALRIANYLGEESAGILKQAIKDSDDLKLSMNRQIKTRVKDIEAVADVKSIEAYDEVAKQGFTDMVDKVSSMNIGVDASDVTKGIDTTKILGGKDDALKAKIVNLEQIIAEKPTQQLSDLLNIQQEINALMDKTSSGTGKYILKQLKTNLGDTIDKATPAELSGVIKTAKTNFAAAKQNITLAKTIESSKDANGVINYNQLKTKLADDPTLNTYETKATINILEQFDKKFNSDYKVFGASAGTSTDGGVLGAVGAVLGPIKRLLFRWGEYGNNVAMQKQISTALASSKTPMEFASKIVRNKATPEEVRQVFLNKLAQLNKADLSALEVKELKVINTDLANKVKKAELVVRGKQQAVAKADYRLEKLKIQLGRAKQKATTPGDVIYDFKEKIRLAEEDVVLANQRADLEGETLDTLRKQLAGTAIGFTALSSQLNAAEGMLDGMINDMEQTPIVHTIKSGDTAESLASLYNLPLEEVKANMPSDQIGAKVTLKPQGYPVQELTMPDVVKRQEAEGFEEAILKPHKPSKNSGLTIGYGYDIKTKDLKKVKRDFKKAGIPEVKALKFYNKKDVSLTKEEALKLADVSWIDAYKKGTRIGIPLNDMPLQTRDKILSLLYRGDIVKGSSKYKGKFYKLAMAGDEEGIDKLATSEEAPIELRNRWKKY